MSNLLRAPWLAGSVHKSLAEWRTKKGSAQPPREYSISPDGDLLLQATKKGVLQLMKFLTYEDPLTAQLSDKYYYISCEFTPTCRSWFEEEHGKDLLKIKGALIHLQEYEIRFVGSDGALSEKGITFRGQLATKGARTNETRKSLTEFSMHHPPEIPIPVFVVQKFQLIACEGECIWGTPKNIQRNAELLTSLAELPRRKTSAASGNGAREKEWRQSAQQVPGTATGGRRIAGNQGDEDDDDEDEDSQPFATQAPNRFSSTYDDFDFETYSQFRAGAPTGSGLSGDSLPSSLRVSQKNSRPLKRKDVGFDDQPEKSPIRPKVQPVAKLRRSHNSDASSHNSMTDSLVLHPGWQGMIEVTKEDSTIPEDQEMELGKETAWYTPQSGVKHPYSSAYNISKNHSTPEKHKSDAIFPRKPTARKTCVTQQKSSPDPSESEDVESVVSWPSSPEYRDPRFLARDVTGTPPHSSMSPVRCLAPPTIPAHKGRSGDSVLEIPVGLEDSPALPNNGGSHQLKSDKNTNKRGKTSDSSRASSKDGSPSFHRGPSKRITRGANGISKRVLPDSTNLALKRPRKRPNLRKLSYNLAGDFEDLEEDGYSDQSSESPAREFSVELPVPVVDPNGRTRVAKYGILGAQQVGIWEKNRRLAKQSDVNTDPLDEDNSFSDTSLPDLDVLEDVGTFKSGNENGTEDRFSEFVGDNSYEEGLHYTSCDVPPSLESNPMQSLLLSNHDGDTVGGNPPCHNLKENPGSFRVLLEMEHSKESNMNDNEKNVPQPQPLLPSQTSFAMNLSVAMQEDGQKKDAPKRELSTNPIKLSSGDQKLDEKKDLLGSEEDIPQNNSQLVASKQASFDAEVRSPQFGQSNPNLKEIYHSSSPTSAATVQVKETPYRGDGQPLLARERAVYMNDDSDQEGIPGTEHPPSIVQVPDSSQDQILRENHEYRENLEVQVPASSEEARMLESDAPAIISKSVERVPSSSNEIRGLKEVVISKTLEKRGRAPIDSPNSTQSTKCPASHVSPTTQKDKVAKVALSPSVTRVLPMELTNLEFPTSAKTKAVGVVDISSDEEDLVPTPPKPVNLREYLKANRAIRDEVMVKKEQVKPEMYAGIRSRSLYIPGQEDRTEKEKQVEDKRRKKYFGTDQARPWNNPWKSVGELARLEKDRLEKEAKLVKVPSSKALAKPKGTPGAEDWFRDPDTPVKVFLRKLRELKQIEDDAAGIGAKETRANE